MMNMYQGYYLSSPLDVINTFRKLWEQHSVWTRSFIISAAHDLPDLQLVTERLLRNPTDFAYYLEPFYGGYAKNFERLLRNHLTIAAELVNAAKKGDTNAVNEARRRWYINGDRIAQLLASINPYWDYEEWHEMLNTHLKLVEQEATLRLQGNYAQDIALYDAIEEQALEMADMMSRGIIAQFML